MSVFGSKFKPRKIKSIVGSGHSTMIKNRNNNLKVKSHRGKIKEGSKTVRTVKAVYRNKKGNKIKSTYSSHPKRRTTKHIERRR